MKKNYRVLLFWGIAQTFGEADMNFTKIKRTNIAMNAENLIGVD